MNEGCCTGCGEGMSAGQQGFQCQNYDVSRLTKLWGWLELSGESLTFLVVRLNSKRRNGAAKIAAHQHTCASGIAELVSSQPHGRFSSALLTCEVA